MGSPGKKRESMFLFIIVVLMDTRFRGYDFGGIKLAPTKNHPRKRA